MNTVVRPLQQTPGLCDEPFLPWVARRTGSRYALAWLPLLVLAPVVSTIQRADLGQLLALLLLAGLHTSVTLLRADSGPDRRTELLVAVSVLVAIGYQVLWSEHQIFLYPLLALSMAVGLRRRRAMGFVGGLAVSGAIAAGPTAGSLADVMSFGIVTYMAGVSAHLVDVLSGTVARLRATEERLARAAVVEERERFSRDLHDLLGHTLSLIVVKAEAVRRFLPADPAAAAEHVRGIEEVGRSALGEVRQAVVGYRETTLQDELEAARDALTGAGLRVRINAERLDLPAAVDGLLAWVVREGTTNILRHARARSCTIVVDSGGGEVTVEIADDGRADGRADGADGANRVSGDGRGDGQVRFGSGLSGLRERAEMLGGVLAADRGVDGFRLGVSVPMEDRERA